MRHSKIWTNCAFKFNTLHSYHFSIVARILSIYEEFLLTPTFQQKNLNEYWFYLVESVKRHLPATTCMRPMTNALVRVTISFTQQDGIKTKVRRSARAQPIAIDIVHICQWTDGMSPKVIYRPHFSSTRYAFKSWKIIIFYHTCTFEMHAFQ